MAKKRTFIEESRRKQIVDIALSLINEHGYRSTTIDMIAKTAGTTKSVIYYHFGGKAQLTDVIWRSMLDNLYEYRKAKVEKKTSAADKLRAYIDSQFDINLNPKHQKYMQAILEAGIYLNSANGRGPWSPSHNARCFAFIVDILKAGQQQGEFGNFLAEELAPVIQAAMDGINIAAYSDPKGIDQNASKKMIIDLVFSYVRPPAG